MEQKTIGRFIASLRKETGITQKQLAERLNVSDKTISHWERGESSPDLSMVPLIADIFDITCDELIRGERNDKASVNEPIELSEEEKHSALISRLNEKFKKFQIQCYMCSLIVLIGLMFCVITCVISKNGALGLTVYGVFIVVSMLGLMLVYSMYVFLLKCERGISRKIKAKYIIASVYASGGIYLYEFVLVFFVLAMFSAIFNIEDDIFYVFIKGCIFLFVSGTLFVLLRSLNLHKKERLRKKHILIGVILSLIILAVSIGTAVFQNEYYNGNIGNINSVELQDTDEVRKIMDEDHNVLFNDKSNDMYSIYDEEDNEIQYEWKNELVTYCYASFDDNDNAIYYIGIMPNNSNVDYNSVFYFLYRAGFFVYPLVMLLSFVVQNICFVAEEKKQKKNE
ncbi:MAG: helix-turn-helix domain-containing protein [Eubacterium sp.]|nr:helix-turn-helix domain-containing protein [Eubacterium sp.]